MMFQPEVEIEHHARLLQIRRLRESGLKYREIAAALGISAARLSQLRPQVDRLPHLEPLTAMSDVSPDTALAYLPLSRRTRSILAASPFETVADLMAAQGRRFGQENLPHCDPRSWREIRTCLAVLDAKGTAVRDVAAA
jgi:transcriptional regulator with XRE-family HTH domain